MLGRPGFSLFYRIVLYHTAAWTFNLGDQAVVDDVLGLTSSALIELRVPEECLDHHHTSTLSRFLPIISSRPD